MPRHRQGPLASFFNQYPGFRYDPTESATDEFRRLGRQQGWNRYNRGRENALEEYKTAVVNQFNVNYGTDVDALESWHLLCKYIGIDPIPDTLEACKREVQRTHVNLMDLVDVFDTGDVVEVFPTVEALSDYTQLNGKYFPRKHVAAGSLLRCLLRQILHPPMIGSRARGKGMRGRGRGRGTGTRRAGA